MATADPKPPPPTTSHPPPAPAYPYSAATANPYIPNPNGAAYANPYIPNPNGAAYANPYIPNPNGAAYAYPPPYYPPPAYPYEDPSAVAARLRFIRCLLTTAVAVFLLFGLVTLITWLILRPVVPVFSLSAASVSNFDLSASQQLSSNFDLTFSVSNPNKKLRIYYDRVEAAVTYGPDPLAATALPPFYQATGGSDSVAARLAVVGGYVEGDVARMISKEREENRSVVFNVVVFSWARFQSGVWRTGSRALRVYCDDVSFTFTNGTTSNGMMIGPPKQCFVSL